MYEIDLTHKDDGFFQYGNDIILQNYISFGCIDINKPFIVNLKNIKIFITSKDIMNEFIERYPCSVISKNARTSQVINSLSRKMPYISQYSDCAYTLKNLSLSFCNLKMIAIRFFRNNELIHHHTVGCFSKGDYSTVLYGKSAIYKDIHLSIYLVYSNKMIAQFDETDIIAEIVHDNEVLSQDDIDKINADISNSIDPNRIDFNKNHFNGIVFNLFDKEPIEDYFDFGIAIKDFKIGV